jgi:8-oxo-dGTP pyrophosphatase MutT (NUDIX family)
MNSFDKKIKSYGIVLFHRHKDKIKFCIYNRRDTYAYYDYLLGFYDPRIYTSSSYSAPVTPTTYTTQSPTLTMASSSETGVLQEEKEKEICVSDRLALLASLMTLEEKERIRNHSFDELWEDLFVNKYIFPYIEKKEEARQKFEFSKERVLKIKSGSNIKDTGWGFPKGKQNKNELPTECAFREFEEETGFTRHECELWDIGPICETFVGYDSRIYETYYYIAETKKDFQTRYIMTPKAIRKLTVSSETYDLKWVTVDDCDEYLCPRQQIVLKKVLALIS